jgi:hypothetical protein
VPEGVPDFLGQSRAVIGDELVDIMDRRDSARFEPLFRAFSRATMAIHDRLVDRVREGHADPRVLQDLLADMLDLSGLALWYSALDGTPFGGLVEKVWDEILAGLQRKDAYLRYCCQADSTSRLPIMSAGAEQRFRWKRHFESALESRGVREPESVPWLSQAPSVKHTNPVIESLHLHLGMTHAKPRDYFVALYLAKQVADQNQLPRAARDVVMAISRAEARIEGVRRASAER